MQYSQSNLVPNGSFEDTITCPSFLGQIQKAKYWYNPTNCSPDYFNPCASYYQAVPPNTGAGHQIAKTGNSFAGLFLNQTNYSPFSDSKEYIANSLSDTLSAGKTYCVKFFVVLAEKYAYATSKIQMLFTNSQTLDLTGTCPVLNFNPQVQNLAGNFIQDTLNWIEIKSVYTASGGEKWITIGNFYDYLTTDTLVIDSTKAKASYYFIDDVSVVEVSPANAGNDTTYCTQDTATIGGLATFAADYVWSKISGNAVIDSVNSANPHVWASSSGTSTFVMQKTQCSVITYDTVSISFSCVGISESQKSKTTCTTFPNPFSNSLTFSLSKSSDYTLLIFDISGKQIQKKTFSGSKYELENFNAESGIYHYCIEDAKGEKLRGKLLKL